MGIASRRKAEEIIAAGRVSINGMAATLGQSVQDGDVVLLDGKPIESTEKLIYIILNKPAGVISSVRDQFGRQTVVDLVGDVGARLYPVGRLDYHSTGLVLLTNDGELTQKLTHPSHGKEKTYTARVQSPIKPDDIKAFREGMTIDGYQTRPAQIELLDKWGKLAKITLFEGRNRQIRKMFAALENEIISLKRDSIGHLTLDGLKSGEHRNLTQQEIAILLKGVAN